MTKSAFLALTFLLILCPAAHAERPAGILLYFKAGTKVYLLLADHATPGSKDRGWGGFGGGPENGESPAETAARETAEETRGFFLAAALLKQIESQTPVIDTNGFALFFAESRWRIINRKTWIGLTSNGVLLPGFRSPKLKGIWPAISMGHVNILLIGIFFPQGAVRIGSGACGSAI